jgi:hypothetical protein
MKYIILGLFFLVVQNNCISQKPIILQKYEHQSLTSFGAIIIYYDSTGIKSVETTQKGEHSLIEKKYDFEILDSVIISVHKRLPEYSSYTKKYGENVPINVSKMIYTEAFIYLDFKKIQPKYTPEEWDELRTSKELLKFIKDENLIPTLKW